MAVMRYIQGSDLVNTYFGRQAILLQVNKEIQVK